MPISTTPTASEINVELGRSANAPFSINGAEERALAQVPSGPITFNDFIGKSASTPINTYENYLLYLGTLTNERNQNGNVSIRTAVDNRIGRWVGFSQNISKTGTNYGSIFAPSSTAVTTDGNFPRFIQHMVDSEAEMDALVANGWEIATFFSANYSTQGSFAAWTRNGYTTESYGLPFEGITAGIVSMLWWNGSQCRRRDANNASYVIPSFVP